MQDDLDPRAILRALGCAESVGGITPVAGGQDTALWRVERAGQTFALRVFRPEQAAVCRREAAVMRGGLAGVPIPAVRAEGTWRDRPALLIDWCPGQTLFAAIMAAPWQIGALAATFGRAQAALHAAPVPAALRDEGRSWIDWQGGVDTALAERLRAAATGRESVLHFDYHPLNVMVEAGRVTGLLDWANVHTGDRRADLARTVTILRLSPAPPGTPRLLVTILGRAVERHWRRGYRAVAGPIGGMAPFYAWAGAAMINDFAPKIGRPGNWLRPHHLEPARRWAVYWRRRSGIVD